MSGPHVPGPAGAQRRGQIHADSHHRRPRPARFGQHPGVRRARQLRGGPRGAGLGAPGPGALPAAHLPREPGSLRPLPGPARQGAARRHPLVPGVGRAGGPRRCHGEDPLRRHAPPPQHGRRHHPPPAPGAAGRAHRGRRSAIPQSDLRDGRVPARPRAPRSSTPPTTWKRPSVSATASPSWIMAA